jgi:hypothetical protein
MSRKKVTFGSWWEKPVSEPISSASLPVYENRIRNKFLAEA